VIQGSVEWALARAGCATASEFSSILAKGQGKTRAAYLRRVVAERLTGKPCESGYRNAHMDRGNEQEPDAGSAYEEQTGNLIRQVGFIRHAELAAGCSPDGLVDANGGGEFKCVIPTVQLDTILSGSYPSEHRAQVQGSLWITEREWWDFCSYSPDMPERHRLYVFRVYRDEDYITKLEAEVRGFLNEADQMIERLMGDGSLEGRLRASLEAA
jgi:hypothetical protein